MNSAIVLGFLRVERLVTGQHRDELADLPFPCLSALDGIDPALSEIYEVVHPAIWQPTLATFTVEAALPTGMAVTPAGSEHDLRFTRSWERLAEDPALVVAYNDLKVRHRDDPAEYERQKSAFFDSLV